MAKRNYVTLDALRGVAALIVVSRHASEYFQYGAFPESFLAVDLFFVLSGFVVADAYEGRLAAGRYFWSFVKTRLIRLYPLYFLGLLLSILFRIGSVRHGESGWTWQTLSQYAFLGLVMAGSNLNGPTWTLLPELCSNVFYGATLRWLNRRTLIAVAALGFAGIIVAEMMYRSLDTGFVLQTSWISISRVAFSFFVGVGIRHATRAKGRRFSQIAPLICSAILAAALLAPVPQSLRAPYELAMVGLGFPILVWIAVHFEPTGLLAKIGSFLGLTSYAIYILHQPLSRLTSHWILYLTHINTSYHKHLFEPLFIIAIILIAWLTDHIYDRPVRRSLMKRFVRREAAWAR